MSTTTKLLSSLLVVATLAPASGCYFGRNHRTGAFVANGTLIALGGAFALSSLDSGGSCEGLGCVGPAQAASAGATLGLVMMGAGLLGVLVNVAVGPPAHATDDADDEPAKPSDDGDLSLDLRLPGAHRGRARPTLSFTSP